MIEYLTLETVVQLHDVLIVEFGGLKGIRDVNLLCSAIETPKASIFGHDLYSTIYDKAAAYLFHIVQIIPSMMAIKEQVLHRLTYFLISITFQLYSMTMMMHLNS